MINRILLSAAFCVSACLHADMRSPAVINLTQSTRIIAKLIATSKIASVLQDCDHDQLTRLLHNKSPAQLAFEAEVLATTSPLVVVYYCKDNEESRKYIQQLEDVATAYENAVKFVVVDAEQLFSLVEEVGLDTLPALLLVQDKECIELIEEPLSIPQLEQKLLHYTT